MALLIYVGFYSCDHRLRTRKGAWQVAFLVETNGRPAIVVNEPFLGVSNLKIVLDGESTTNPPGDVAFDFPLKPVPFGRVEFEDLTYLPGTVTLDLFGHEIEFLPRTLVVNTQERPWQSDATIHLSPAEKIPGLTTRKPHR